jgi:hypothetical protein
METKNCPFCAEEILLAAKKCKHCGEFLDESLKKEPVAPVINVTQTAPAEKKPSNMVSAVLLSI